MRHSANSTFISAAIFLAAPILTLASPVITNGNFEAVQIGAPFVTSDPTDIPGWTHGGIVGDGLLWAVGYADGGGSVTTAGSGNQFITMGGGYGTVGSADWSTTIIGLVAGNSYVLNFMTATELGTGEEPGGPQTMTVGFLSGSSTAAESYTSPDSPAAYWRNWVTQNYTFVATNTTAVVDFSVTNQEYDMGLDNVNVVALAAATPEPSSLLMAGVGLIWFARIAGRNWLARQ